MVSYHGDEQTQEQLDGDLLLMICVLCTVNSMRVIVSLERQLAKHYVLNNISVLAEELITSSYFFCETEIMIGLIGAPH